jgi:DNA-binding transcriptional regulator LsrR (DeoR family)
VKPKSEPGGKQRPKLKRYLPYEERYEIAYLYFFRDVTQKVLASTYNISLPTVSKIKREFIKVEERWLDKPVPDQLGLELKISHTYQTTIPRK